MSLAPLEDLVTLNRLVHEPARFAILTALTPYQKADFQFLQAMTGLAQGNLSGHLQKLEAGRLITIDKRFKGKYPQTWLEITVAGRAAFEEHRRRLHISVTPVKDCRALSGTAIPLEDPSGTMSRGSAAPSPSAADSLREIRRLPDGAEPIDAALERHVGHRCLAAEELGLSLATRTRTLRRRRGGDAPSGERGV
jgi:DNA-binding transcriptional ArsR family regulator